VWQNQLHDKHFYIPEFVRDISHDSKARVIRVEGTAAHGSQEQLLEIFVKKCFLLYDESRHQQLLKRFELSGLWNLQYYLSWIMFSNAVVMNILILVYYKTIEPRDGSAEASSIRQLAEGTPYTSTTAVLHMDVDASTAVLLLSFLQLAMASLSWLILLVVRIPVLRAVELKSGRNGLICTALSLR
jgi:hypothetical protein